MKSFFFVAFMVCYAMLLTYLLAGCATVTPANPLYKRVLKYRPGNDVLTHSTCTETDWKGRCTKLEGFSIDPRNDDARKQLIDLGFICSIGGRRYKLDPDAPQFVRYRLKKGCWLFCKDETVKEEPIPMEPAQRLIDAGTECYSEKAYPDGIYL